MWLYSVIDNVIKRSQFSYFVYSENFSNAVYEIQIAYPEGFQ